MSGIGQLAEVTLCCYHSTMSPAEMSALLDLEPTRTQTRGAPSSFPELGPIPVNGWFLSSNGLGDRDVSHHLGWMIERLEQRRREFRRAQELAWEVHLDISWPSVGGMDSLTLTPSQLRLLAALEIEVRLLPT